GSSAMPHKRNPITAERVSGLARVIRGHAVAALEDVALWHERDISHSSVERVILPDATILLDYLLDTTRRLVEGLVVDPERMTTVLGSSFGLVYSQRVLLALVRRGLTREAAYAVAQRSARRVGERGRGRGKGGLAGGGVRGGVAEGEVAGPLGPGLYVRDGGEVEGRVGAVWRRARRAAPGRPSGRGRCGTSTCWARTGCSW